MKIKKKLWYCVNMMINTEFHEHMEFLYQPSKSKWLKTSLCLAVSLKTEGRICLRQS